MATLREVLSDSFGRAHESVRATVAGLTVDELAWRPDEQANSIAWLVWHLARVQDDSIAMFRGEEQLWTADGWSDRFALPVADDDTGYGHSAEQVASVRASAESLRAYYDEVHLRTVGWLGGLSYADLDRVVDDSWDPPVTGAVRIVSILEDVTQHAGQAGYVRGLLERRRAVR